MALPQAQIILDQLVVWLSEIRQANGYHTEGGVDIRTEQDRTDQPLGPCLYVLDEAARWGYVTGVPSGKWTQSVSIEGLVFDDGTGRLVSRQLLSDVHRALRRPVTAWPPAAGVHALREIQRTIDVRPQDSDWLTPTVSLEIDYVDKEVTP